MGYYIDRNGSYYEGDQIDIDDVEVPQRLSSIYIWSDGWVIDIALATVAFEQAIQDELDADAKAKGYDSILSACSYAAASNPFQAEAKLYVTRRGNAWAYCYQELDKVKAGTREMPTIEQIISELPPRVSAS